MTKETSNKEEYPAWFTRIPVESETRILASHSVPIRNLKAIHQLWYWEGFLAESLIFPTESISGFRFDEFFVLAMETGLIQNPDQITLTTTETGFTFLNFNFRRVDEPGTFSQDQGKSRLEFKVEDWLLFPVVSTPLNHRHHSKAPLPDPWSGH